MKQIIPFKQELLFKTKISEITSISLEHTLSLKEDDLISGEFLITGDYKMTEGSINREKFSFNLPFEISLDSRYDINNIIIDIDNFYYEIVNNESLQVNIDVYFEGEKKEEPKQEIEMEIDTVEETKEEIRKESTEINKDNLINEKEIIPAIDESRTVTNPSQEDVSIIDEKDKNIIEKNIEYSKINKELELTDNTFNNNITNNDTDIINSSDNLIFTNNNPKFDDNNISNIDNNTKTIKEETKITENKDNIIFNNDFNIFENIDNSDTYVTYHIYIVKEDDSIDTIIDKYGVSKEEIANYNDITNINPGDKIIIPNKNE